MRTTFSMSYAIGDVILVPIPFSDLTSHKVRPAIVVGIPSPSKDLFVVPISSQVQNTDLPLQDWRAAGLNVACGAKAQLATLESALILKRIGRLSQNDYNALSTRLRAWLSL